MYLERFRVTDRVAVVTGGAQGIGLSCVEALAEAGARVVIADLNAELTAKARAEMLAKGYAVDSVQMDVTDSKAVKDAAAEIVGDKGAIDILVCNAGIAISGPRAEDATDEQWLKVFDVNLNGLFWCCREFGGHMLRAGRGVIVNIGSMSALIVNKPQAQAPTTRRRRPCTN